MCLVLKHFPRFVLDSNHYQYQVLPFGLSVVLHVFMKCLAVVAYLGSTDIQMVLCLSKWLVMATKSQV